MKRNITIMIKPASSLCNLACTYCFYHDIAENRAQASFGLIKEDIVDNIIQKSLDYAEGGSVTFAFQGGEPLLYGLEGFQNFVKIVKEKNTSHAKVNFALQTNGTLLTAELCQFFKENNFLIGISIDGESQIHNAHRIYKDGKGSFNVVMQKVQLLQKYNVDFNALVVVTRKSYRNAKSIYNFFMSKGINYIQFITCLENMNTTPFSSPYSLTCDQYFKFYSEVFDCYFADLKRNKPVHIRYFDNLIEMILHGAQPELCGMSGVCSGQLIVEGNGNLYPCDFYCEDQYLLGNILDSDLKQISKSENMQKFVRMSYHVDEDCRHCEVANICRGGCRRERDFMSDGVLQKNIYCTARKQLFLHIINELRKA